MEKMNARKKAARAARLRKQRTRRALLTLCLMLAVAVVSVGGTLAWLQASTTPVVNTFSPANISLDLEETWNTDGDDEDTDPDHWEAHMVPGTTVKKDPKITASSDVPYYVFVEVSKANWNTNIEYTIAPGWTKANIANKEVYYKEMAANASLTNDSLFVKDQVTISSDLKKEDMPAANAKPTMTITAYAIQQYKSNTEKFTIQEAWELASAQATGD